MKVLACTFLLSLVALKPSAAAEAPASESGGTSESAAGIGQPIALKNTSAFVLDSNGRSPFWPIGWKPALGSSGAGEQPTVDISPSSFAVTSITVERGGRYAIINGKVMSEGQTFGLKIGNQIHEVSVKSIQDGQVIMSQNGHDLSPVLLRRR